jgi:hypothetical protein
VATSDIRQAIAETVTKLAGLVDEALLSHEPHEIDEECAFENEAGGNASGGARPILGHWRCFSVYHDAAELAGEVHPSRRLFYAEKIASLRNREVMAEGALRFRKSLKGVLRGEKRPR